MIHYWIWAFKIYFTSQNMVSMIFLINLSLVDVLFIKNYKSVGVLFIAKHEQILVRALWPWKTDEINILLSTNLANVSSQFMESEHNIEI